MWQPNLMFQLIPEGSICCGFSYMPPLFKLIAIYSK